MTKDQINFQALEIVNQLERRFPNYKRRKSPFRLRMASIKRFVVEFDLLYRKSTLENRVKLLSNFISIFQDAYGNDFYNNKVNPFITNIGFGTSIDFLCGIFIRTCYRRKSFTKETMKVFLPLNKDNKILLEKEETKGLKNSELKSLLRKRLDALLVHDGVKLRIHDTDKTISDEDAELLYNQVYRCFNCGCVFRSKDICDCSSCNRIKNKESYKGTYCYKKVEKGLMCSICYKERVG